MVHRLRWTIESSHEIRKAKDLHSQTTNMTGPITRVFVDTSVLRGDGFTNPSFAKLLHRSKAGTLKICVARIAWEERRKQFLESAYSEVGKIRQLFESIENKMPHHFILKMLSPPALSIWNYEEVEDQSKKAMDIFAAEHKIEILEIKHEHALRSWNSYFTVGRSAPFGESSDSKQRRSDIPDSWIYETAVDLVESGEGLVALCADGNLGTALKNLGIPLFSSSEEVVAQIEQAEILAQEGIELSTENPTLTPLEEVLSSSDEEFRQIERRLLGYVAYFGIPTKDQIFRLFSDANVNLDVTQNAAQRLIIKGLLRDTGNHFLVPNDTVADQSRQSVEEEIIGLLTKE